MDLARWTHKASWDRFGEVMGQGKLAGFGEMEGQDELTGLD